MHKKIVLVFFFINKSSNYIILVFKKILCGNKKNVTLERLDTKLSFVKQFQVDDM